MPRSRRQELGAGGEALVARHYEARGYRVVARNWRCPAGELDLVLRKGRELVFCEVKTRSSAAFGLPAEAVGREKQLRLRRLALTWLASSGRRRPSRFRFDVASVLAGEVEIIEDAF